ncbi:MAG: hypothetical protein IJU65_04360 [Desulfovibrio sp.]|nr:hypothetical protein [Desulfovibrio sp.]
MTATAQHNFAMEQAWGVIKHLSADEQERAEAEAVEKARRDMVARLRSAEILGHTKGLAEGKKAGIAEGKKAGLVEGKKAGLQEGKAEVALAMLGDGLPMEQITRFTGLTADAIKRLRKLQ